MDLGGAPLDSCGDGCHTTTGSEHSKSCCPTPSPALQPSSSLLDVLHEDAGAPSSSAPSVATGIGRLTLEQATARAMELAQMARPTERDPSAPGCHCLKAACRERGGCDCDGRISEFQFNALTHDVVEVLEATTDWCYRGRRDIVTQGGEGDGIFHPEIEPALRVVTLAAMGPCLLTHSNRAWDPVKYRTDKTFWEPDAARDKCVDCKTKLM